MLHARHPPTHAAQPDSQPLDMLPYPAADHLAAYYGDQLPALECVKLKYDPANQLSMPMDIRPPTGSAAHCPELLRKVGTAAAAYSRYLLSSGPARSAAPSYGQQTGISPASNSSQVHTANAPVNANKSSTVPAGSSSKQEAGAWPANTNRGPEAAQKMSAGRKLARHRS
jgi:hypothetical protein